MKWSATLALGAAVSAAFAQQGPPPGGPPRQGGNRQTSQNQTQNQNRVAGSVSESARLLTLSTVQNDLGLTLNQWTTVNATIRSLRPTAFSEDQAFATLAKTLTAAQSSRLKELLVQDLGYGSLALTDIRTELALTADQSKTILELITTLETTKKALATANPSSAQQAITTLQTQTNAQMAKLLTPEQDAKLRSLVGKAIGSK